MSVLPLTPSVIQALRTDFRQGTWSATTQQFFQQLFTRVGGTTSDTNTELAAAVAVLEATVAILQNEIDALEATLAGFTADIGVAPPRQDGDAPDVGLFPREEFESSDFDLGWAPPWPLL